MNELERYLAEEIALDHADGHITRREALRRLGLMGIGAASAGALGPSSSLGTASISADATHALTCASSAAGASRGDPARARSACFTSSTSFRFTGTPTPRFSARRTISPFR